MKLLAWAMALALPPLAVAAAAPEPPADAPMYAFFTRGPVTPHADEGPQSVEGSARKYTWPEIENLRAPPDWFPDQHQPMPEIVAKGRAPPVFACASCHLEGDEDKLTWFVADGPRQTPTLAGRLLGTGPFNWGGTEEGLQSNMDKTIERMGGHGLVKGELAALESFLLTGLPERPNPNRAATGLTEAQERGRKLFKDPVVACASCHTGDGLTDGRNWDVGTAASAEVEARGVLSMQTGTKPTAVTFNTPSLRGLWHTGPYLHDGSADSIEQLLKRTDGAMGKTSHLTKSELADLVAYLKTL